MIRATFSFIVVAICCAKQTRVLLFATFFFQLATLKFVAWQVEHGLVIRATTRSTCNATVLRDKLNENVARITWPVHDFVYPIQKVV